MHDEERVAAKWPEVRTRALFHLRIEPGIPQRLGPTPAGERLTVPVLGGTFEGERLSGTVLEGGSDWIAIRSDGTWTLDVRLTLRTREGDLVGMTYRGLRHGPAEIIAQVNEGRRVEPGAYYFRTAIAFETGSSRYEWLGRIIALGLGYREPGGPRYHVFELL